MEEAYSVWEKTTSPNQSTNWKRLVSEIKSEDRAKIIINSRLRAINSYKNKYAATRVKHFFRIYIGNVMDDDCLVKEVKA